MERLKPMRCCCICGGIFPIKSHYGLASSVYCHVSEHWRAAGLNPREISEELEAFARFEAKLDAEMERLRAALDPPTPLSAVSEDADREARFRHMLKPMRVQRLGERREGALPVVEERRTSERRSDERRQGERRLGKWQRGSPST